MSDTPRTDAAIKRTSGLFRAAAQTNGFADFSRELERELAMAKSFRAQADVIAENTKLRATIDKCRHEHSDQAKCWGDTGDPENAAYHRKWEKFCSEALAATPESATKEVRDNATWNASPDSLLTAVVAAGAVAVTLGNAANELGPTGCPMQDAASEELAQLREDKARIDACVPPNRGLAIVYADGNAIPCVCRTRDDIDAARAAK